MNFFLQMMPIVFILNSMATSFCLGRPKQISRSHSTLTTVWAREKSKWDDLTDDDEDFYDSIPVAADMEYIPRNLVRASENFKNIRGVGGKDMTNDIYVRQPDSDVFWYTGKVARVSDISLEKSIARQWHMIERHATNLRPIELWPHRGKLEIWTAPGDSEMDVAYNRPTCCFQKMEREIDGASKVRNHSIGFQGEVYQQGEEGFRTWRTDDGLPARPEINPGGETRPPTDEEYAQIQQELQQRSMDDSGNSA